jgi:hypothetical protein
MTRAEPNTNRLVHGGAAAAKAISQGKDFVGLAREVEQVVTEEYDSQGPAALLRRDAIRLQAAADLYWEAVMGAAREGNLPKYESYCRSFGWLTGAASRLLVQLAALPKHDDGQADAIIQGYRVSDDA